MAPSGTIQRFSYPEWYVIEAEACNALNRLDNLRSLSFYLENPNEFIRYHAVKKLCSLRSREAQAMLSDILASPAEPDFIKALAAYGLSTSSVASSNNAAQEDRYVQMFMLHQEKTEAALNTLRQLFKADEPDFSFELPEELTYHPIDGAAESLNFEYDFKSSFPFDKWLRVCTSRKLTRIAGILRHAVRLPLYIPAAAFSGLCSTYRRFCAKKNFLSTATSDNPRPSGYGYKMPARSKLRIFTAVREVAGSLLFHLLYCLFSPVRLAIRLKKAIITAAILALVLISLSDSAKTTFHRFTGVNADAIQDRIVLSVMETYLSMQKHLNLNPPQRSMEQTLPPYIVTARSGLNLRELPGEQHRKVSGIFLSAGEVVFYLGKKEQDSRGKIWFNVRTKSGHTGWVLSDWLMEGGR